MFLLLSFAAGGFFSAMAITVGDGLYLPIDLKNVVAAFFLLYGTLSLVFQKLHILQKRSYKQIQIQFHGYNAEFTALHDTGNELYDPITNLPVIICTPNALSPLFPCLDLSIQDVQKLYLSLCSLPDCPGTFKLIPYQTIAGSGLLVGFRPDQLTVDGAAKNALIGISPFHFSKNEAYQAIY